MEDKDTASIGWFVAGLTLGALLGVLFAPKSGKETREDIVQGAREGRDYLTERGREVQEHFGSAVERGKDQLDDLTGRAKEKLNRGRSAVDNLRLAALNAVACAVEMRRLRPQGKVQ